MVNNKKRIGKIHTPSSLVIIKAPIKRPNPIDQKSVVVIFWSNLRNNPIEKATTYSVNEKYTNSR